MLCSLTSVLTWQQLRLLARGRNKPLSGRTLRLGMGRSTKDGTFLDTLVAEGLLEVVQTDARPSPVAGVPNRLPAQFLNHYRLTPLGLHAAEYGEYERAPKKAISSSVKSQEV